MDQAADYVEAVRPQLESAVTTAKDKALPLLAEARDKAAPVIADAREKAGPALADARAKATPVLAGGAAMAADKAALGAALAAEKSAMARDLAAEKAAVAREVAAAKVAQIKGEPPKKKGGKLKKLVLVGGLVAVGGVVAKKLRGDSGSDHWQSSYTPTPPPTATEASPAGDKADDEAGSSPDEAMSDSAEQPHAVTTPDEPADVVTIDEDAARKA